VLCLGSAGKSAATAGCSAARQLPRTSKSGPQRSLSGSRLSTLTPVTVLAKCTMSNRPVLLSVKVCNLLRSHRPSAVSDLHFVRSVAPTCARCCQLCALGTSHPGGGGAAASGHALLVHSGADRSWSSCHHFDLAFRASARKPPDQVESTSVSDLCSFCAIRRRR